MDVSMFDPASFLAQETTEAATRRPPLKPSAEVGEYTATIAEVKPSIWQKSDGSKSGLMFEIPLTVEVPLDQQESAKQPPTLTFTDKVFVDLTDSGLMDWAPGKNRGLRAYREATGQNVAGQPWAASKLVGQIIKVRIGHRVIEQGNSAGEITEEIKGIVKL